MCGGGPSLMSLVFHYPVHDSGECMQSCANARIFQIWSRTHSDLPPRRSARGKSVMYFERLRRRRRTGSNFNAQLDRRMVSQSVRARLGTGNVKVREFVDIFLRSPSQARQSGRRNQQNFTTPSVKNSKSGQSMQSAKANERTTKREQR